MRFKFKKNLLLINAFFFIGYTNVLHADQCGILRYLANKSDGVTITGNTCKIIDDIALGSAFNLLPGARLWLKSQMGTDATMQLICQNSSQKSIRINLDSATQPWITANGLANCSLWVDNKMNCNENTNDQNVLICVIASVNSELLHKKPEERTTSIKMRSLPSIDALHKIKTSEKVTETKEQQIVSAMQPDFNLCRAVNHTDSTIKISWQVSTVGQVNRVISVADETGTQRDADKPFIDCLKAVITDFPYPHSSQAIWLSNQF